MVEFGLKLSDNKVTKWSSHYIDYEKLKVLLKAAKSALKARDAIKAKHDKYLVTNNLPFPPPPTDSNLSLLGLASPTPQTEDKYKSSTHLSNLSDLAEQNTAPLPKTNSNPNKKQPWLRAFTTAPSPSETDSLLPSSSLPSSLPSSPPPSSTRAKTGTLYASISAAITNIGNPNDLAKYTKALAKSTAAFDLAEMEFAACLKDELRKVEDFYIKKTSEYTTRLDVLIEAVELGRPTPPPPRTGVSDAELESSSYKRTRTITLADVAAVLSSGSPKLNPNAGKKSLKDSVKLRESKQKLRDAAASPIDVKPSSDAKTHDDDDSDRDNDDDDANKWDDAAFKQLVQVDSIKRAAIDLHRNVKLILNYSIMNYTGFVKIIKKHDKSVTTHKGKYKGLCDSSTFYNGAAAEALSQRMELSYAEWFCDGDLQSARAQMLPKVGDGLEMDFSQMRFG